MGTIRLHWVSAFLSQWCRIVVMTAASMVPTFSMTVKVIVSANIGLISRGKKYCMLWYSPHSSHIYPFWNLSISTRQSTAIRKHPLLGSCGWRLPSSRDYVVVLFWNFQENISEPLFYKCGQSNREDRALTTSNVASLTTSCVAKPFLY